LIKKGAKKIISFGILYNSEVDYMNDLLKQIAKHVDYDYEIVIVEDECKDEESKELFNIWKKSSHIKVFTNPLNHNFGEQKNFLNSKCEGDFIFNIAPDELPHEFLLQKITKLIEGNPEIEVYRVPRINTVEGITDEHLRKWGWRVNQNGWINFPDWQLRIYKNSPKIYWVNKVHETLDGYKTITKLPHQDGRFCLRHHKTIERQILQNEYYENIA